MSVITGDGSSYPATFEGPDDADERDAASVLVALEALADRTEYIKQRVFDGEPGLSVVYNLEVVNDALVNDGLDVLGHTSLNTLGVSGAATIPSISGNTAVSGTVTAGNVNATSGQVSASTMLAANGYGIPTRSVTVAIDAPADGDDWEINWEIPYEIHWITTAASSVVRPLRIALNAFIPPGATITSIVARYTGASGHSALPGTMPQLVYYRKRIGASGAASGALGTQSDTSADETAYETEHDITLTPSAHTTDPATGVYYVILFSEADVGANAIAGAKLHGLRVTYSYSRVDRV